MVVWGGDTVENLSGLIVSIFPDALFAKSLFTSVLHDSAPGRPNSGAPPLPRPIPVEKHFGEKMQSEPTKTSSKPI